MNGSSRFHPLSLLHGLILADWQTRARVVLTGLILWQYAVWFDDYFLPATEWLVRGTIVAVMVTEWFPRVRVFWRRLAAVLLFLVLIAYRLNIEVEGVIFGEGFVPFAETLGEGLRQAAFEMHPYIWFVLGTAAIHWLLSGWLTERGRILFATLSSVILFALVDSYSKLILWEQAAIIVFAGLGLLIVEHLDKFRSKHPASWSHLQEYPGSVIIPAVIVLSLVILAGSVAPNARPLLTDPYTLYKHWKGEKVVTGGKGFAGEVTPEAPILTSESGYTRDDSVLGGGFRYDFSEVMRVNTNHPSYWRGEAKSFYTGAGWVDSSEEFEDPLAFVYEGQPLPAYEWEPAPPSGRTVRILQRVTVFGENSDYRVLFGAPGLDTIRIRTAISDGESSEPGTDDASGRDAEGTNVPAADGSEVLTETVWLPRQGELFWMGDEYPRVYGVESVVQVTDEEAWRGVPMEAFGQLYEEGGDLWSPYLQLPDTLPERVRRLAAEIAAEGDTPYDKVKRIEQYLKTTYPYDNLPDVSKGQSADFVDRFLFEIKEGYCDYFSTAMAVMVRSIGLPARWVKGFKTGIHEAELRLPAGSIPDRFAMEQLRSGEGTYIVRNADAHSWVEVYFPGYGWISFEPTSGFSLPVVRDGEEALETTAGTTVEPSADPESGSEGTTGAAAAMIAWAVAIGAALIGLLFWFVHRLGLKKIFRPFRRNPFAGKPARSLNDLALIEAGRILKLLKRKGYFREPYETVREAADRWIEGNRWLKPELERLVAVVEHARYSPNGVTEEQVSMLEAVRRRLKEELK